MQYLILIGVYFITPDYPAKNQGLTYFNILTSMAKYAVTEPKQAAIINIAGSACFSNFWVTLTFLLGLFGLLTMLGVATGPFIGRLIDRLVPWYATFVSTFLLLIFQAVQTGAGGINIVAVTIACFGLDVFRQTRQVSLTSSVFTISTDACSRLSAVMIISLFIGQVIGTSVGTKVFILYGWRAAALLSMGFYVLQLAVLLTRRPHAERYTWFGYEGGLEARISTVGARQTEHAEDGDGTGECEK